MGDCFVFGNSLCTNDLCVFAGEKLLKLPPVMYMALFTACYYAWLETS